MEENIRLQKYLANAGIASRRKCEEYIENGLVKVNGETITELGTRVNPKTDKISFNGKEIESKNEEFVYILLNKPIRVCNNSKGSIWKRYCVRFSKGKDKISTCSEGLICTHQVHLF